MGAYAGRAHLLLYELNMAAGLRFADAHAIGVGSDAKMAPKTLGEMALIEKPGDQSNFCQRQVRIPQKSHRFGGPATREILGGSAMEGGPERSGQVNGMHADLPRYAGNLHLPGALIL